MRAVLLSLILCLMACAPPKSTSRLHTVDMDIDGPRVYDYRIDYGETILPFGNGPDPDFGGGSIYQAKMPLPGVAVASWRTEPAPEGTVVRFVVPIHDQVTEKEWLGDLFTLEFRSTPTTLKVFVANGSIGMLGHGETRRLIYSSTTKPEVP